MKKVLFKTALWFILFSSQALAQESSDLYAFPEKMRLEIKMTDCVLLVYKLSNDGSDELITEISVATVRRDLPKYPFGSGKITRVDLDPFWFPTEESVSYMNKQLISRGKKPLFKKGESIGPNDPRNAMGTFKMHLSHSVPGKGAIYRIHGTNSPSSIGKRASSGCIRVKNAEGRPLAENVRERLKRGETINVEITR